MSFGCFVLVNDTEVLDSKRAFVALSLFNILRFPLSMLPNVISNVVQVSYHIRFICVKCELVTLYKGSKIFNESRILYNLRNKLTLTVINLYVLHSY